MLTSIAMSRGKDKRSSLKTLNLSKRTTSEFIKAACKYRYFFLFACVGSFTYFTKTLFGKDISNTQNLRQSFHCAAGLMHLVYK